jgi:hypothetical protein
MLSALGQRDVERRRRLFGIVEEHLVEIAHPVEQQIIRMCAFDLQILRHHGRGCIACRRRHSGCRAGCLLVVGRWRIRRVDRYVICVCHAAKLSQPPARSNRHRGIN